MQYIVIQRNILYAETGKLIKNLLNVKAFNILYNYKPAAYIYIIN